MANPLTGLSIVATDATKLVKEVICSSVLVVFEPKILFKLSNIPIPAPIPGISFPPDLNKLILSSLTMYFLLWIRYKKYGFKGVNKLIAIKKEEF
jgi:hypothetical protein